MCVCVCVRVGVCVCACGGGGGFAVVYYLMDEHNLGSPVHRVRVRVTPLVLQTKLTKQLKIQ